MTKEAAARIKINKMLEAAGWRFFADANGPATIQLEPKVTLKSQDLDALGENFEKTKNGFIDFLLLNDNGFPFIVLEAKAEKIPPLSAKEQARKYAESQKCRFVILSNGNQHYFWDLTRGNPEAITAFPSPGSIIGFQKSRPNPKLLVDEVVSDDYVALTQRPGYANEAAWKNDGERSHFIQTNGLRFLRHYQKNAIHAIQKAVKKGSNRFLLEMATGTGKTLTAAEIEGYQKVINGARAVIDHYRPHISIHPDWPMAALGDISEVTSSKRILAEEYVPSGTPFYRTKEIVELSKGHDISLELFISQERFDTIKARFGSPAKGELLISAVGTIGVSWVVADDREFYFKDGNLLWIRNLSNLDPYFLKHCLDSTFAGGIDHIVFGAAYKALTIEKLKEFKIPLPPLATQQAIVAEIEAEQALVAANRELIARFEKKIQTTLARIWGEEALVAAEA